MLTRATVLERLSQSRALGGDGPHGRRRSNEDAQAFAAAELLDAERNPFIRGDRPLKDAAVLVPLIDRADGLTVMLTRRTDH